MTSWDLYRYFLQVARSGSFAAASRLMHVSQPTVSRKIEQLQSELSVRLFEQDERGAHLTPRGEALLSLCEAMEKKAEAIRGIAHHAADTEPVRVATTLGLATWLGGRLEPAAEPPIPTTVLTGIQLADIMHFQADIALRMGHPGDDSLHGRKVADVACGLYASPDVAGRLNGMESLEDALVVESVAEIKNLPQVRELRSLTPVAETLLSADNVSVQIEAVAAGHGIAAFPCFMASKNQGLVRIFREQFDVRVDLWLLLHPSLRGSPRVRSVYDRILQIAKDDAPLFEDI